MPSRVDIKEKRRVLDDFFKVEEAHLSFEKFDGTMSPDGSMSFRRHFRRCQWSLCGLLGLLVDCGFRQLSQGLVRFLLFLQGFIEKTHGLLQTKLLCPCFQRSIPGDLIVLHRLRRGEQAGVKGGRILKLLHDLLAFIDDPVDGIAGFAFCRLVDDLEDLL
jgi:hypothetical protein